MSANGRFYWIKLKTNFFNREDIDFMLSQKNGAEYVVLYQMLCLNTANNEGRLETRMNEVIIPYNVEKITRDCKYFDVDTVNVAMALYKKLGLIYEEETDGILRISDYDDMVGSETSYAEKMRKYRNKKQLSYNVADNVEDIVRQENRDKSIEYRDKNLEIENKKNSVSVSVSEAELLDFFQRFQIDNEDSKNIIIHFLNNGMSLEVIKNGMLIPFDRNIKGFDFENGTAPIEDTISYGLTILKNWDNFGVKTLEDVKKYNKLNRNRETMINADE